MCYSEAWDTARGVWHLNTGFQTISGCLKSFYEKGGVYNINFVPFEGCEAFL